jgi:hypothetical protein
MNRMAVPYLACMAFVASFNHLPPRVLPSIMAVEGGVVGVPHLNADGSEDLGVMQVNSRWLPAISRATGLAPSAVRARLLYQPCFDINVAGAILKAYVAEAHGNLMLAIGYYHSHTQTLNLTYQRQVMAAARSIFVTPRVRQSVAFAPTWSPG